MVAWRARIGLIKPTHRGKSFAYWYKNAPEGIEIVPTFIGFRSEKKESFLEGFKRAEELAVQLKEVGCDIISISGTPPFLLKGLDFERQWGSDLAHKIGQERCDHFLLFGHLPQPDIRFDAHIEMSVYATQNGNFKS